MKYEGSIVPTKMRGLICPKNIYISWAFLFLLDIDIGQTLQKLIPYDTFKKKLCYCCHLWMLFFVFLKG
jgi:hypothetical protein